MQQIRKLANREHLSGAFVLHESGVVVQYAAILNRSDRRVAWPGKYGGQRNDAVDSADFCVEPDRGQDYFGIAPNNLFVRGDETPS